MTNLIKENTIDTKSRPMTPSRGNTYEMCDDLLGYIKGTSDIYHNGMAFNIPKEIVRAIRSKTDSASVMRSLAKITYTSMDSLDVVVENDSEQLAGWVRENEVIQDGTKKSKLSKMSIKLHELYAKPNISQRLLDDPMLDVAEFIQDKIAIKMALIENAAFINGDGKHQPRGILSYPLLFDKGSSKFGYIQAVKSGRFGNVKNYEALVEMINLLPSRYLNNAVWLMSRSTASDLRFFRDEETKRFLWQNSISSDIPDTLLGFPVIICDDMPGLSNEKATTPILFGDIYQAYNIAEQGEMSILKDPYVSKPFVEFYATKRVGGDMVDFEAVKALSCEP